MEQLSEVLQVRMPPTMLHSIEQEANRIQVKPSTYARILLAQALSHVEEVPVAPQVGRSQSRSAAASAR